MYKKVLVLGWDGYIGFASYVGLTLRGKHVIGMDNYITRKRVAGYGSASGIAIDDPETRKSYFDRLYGLDMEYYEGDVCDYKRLKKVIERVRPDAVIHLAEQRSAPYSMLDREHAIETQTKNLSSTLNLIYAVKEIDRDIHIIKLGTMGEYGTPNIDIEEGFIEIEHHGRKDVMPYPRQASSWYHLSKVHDSHNLMFACNNWGLKVTDINQGVVYGNHYCDNSAPEIHDDCTLLSTRFDFDEFFGTVLNRFCVQSVLGMPLTVYGEGGQTRGFLSLSDVVQCLDLVLDHEPEGYNVVNQFDRAYSVNDVAEIVRRCSNVVLGYQPEIIHLENPRTEKERHYYNVKHEKLSAMGYKPIRDIYEDVELILSELRKPENLKILESRKWLVNPSIRWKS